MVCKEVMMILLLWFMFLTFQECKSSFSKGTFLSSFPLINGVTRMKIFCETKHLSTLAEELWRTASTRFLVKSITIWSQLLWYWPNLYERSVILINAQFILSPHLLFPSVWQNLSEWKCKCFAIYILFSAGSIYWFSNISSGRHLEPGLFLLWTGYWNICYWPH